jgi:hypothetical protein
MSLSRKLLLLAVLPVLHIAADTITYTYVGKDFTHIVGADYTDNDFVSASVTLLSPLGADAPLQYIPQADVLEWSITDKVYSVSSSSPGLPYLFLSLSTDSAGDISSWEFFGSSSLGAFEAADDTVYTENDGYASDVGELTPFDGGYNLYTPGVWTTETPEPFGENVLLPGAFLLLLCLYKMMRGVHP